MSSADFSRLTAIVHTHGQPASIDRLVKSVGWLCPQIRILIADDSGQSLSLSGADAVKVPAGVGVSACRNTLLARVRTPYFLLLEDAMELSRRSGVDRLLEIVAAGKLDVAAGEVVRCQRRFGLFTTRTPEPGHGAFHFDGDTLRIVPGPSATLGVHSPSPSASLGVHPPGPPSSLGVHPPGPNAHPCDITHNFFVGRVDKIRAIGGWDAQLQVEERIEFFYRACRYGLKVGVRPESIAWRWPQRRPERTPARDFSALAVAKIGVSRLIDAEGRIHQAAATTSRAA